MDANDLLEFLENKLDDSDGGHHTHVSVFGSRYELYSKPEYEKLWLLYCDALSDLGHEKFKLGLAEKPLAETPILVDIDLKVKGVVRCKEPDSLGIPHLYTRWQVKKVASIFQSVIKRVVENVTSSDLTCVVLEKPALTLDKDGETYTKNGFHLHFPAIFLSREEQKMHLIPRAKAAIREMDIFSDLGIEDSGSLVDNGVVSVSWLMYGSRKKPTLEPYVVTSVLNDKCEEIDLELAFRDYTIYNDKEEPINMVGNVKHNLPRILSILPYGRQTRELKSGLGLPGSKTEMTRNVIQSKIQASIPPLMYDMPCEAIEEKSAQLTEKMIKTLAEARILVDMLAPSRCEVYLEWLGIGWTLFCIGDGCKEAFDVWDEYSSRSVKYDSDRCIIEWNKMQNKGRTIRTLHYLAQSDNKEAYEAYLKDKGKGQVNSALEGSHRDIANIVYTQYRYKFACAEVGNSGAQWFNFENHRWKEASNGVAIRNILSEEIVDIFEEECQKCAMQMGTTTDKASCAFYTTRKGQMQKIIKNLKTNHFKRSVEKETADVFYDEFFKDKLNKDPYLFCFNNGVYDLKSNTFRDGRPEDYLTTYSSTDYDPTLTEESPSVIQMRDFLMKVFPDPELRTYFLDTTCEVFVGGNHQKIVLVWTGDGDNAKSVTQLLLEKMLGKYSIKFSTALITGKKSAIGSASPELARAGDGVRWAVLQEPNNDEEINVGTLKELSGNDSYWARDLFEKGKATQEIVPMFKLVLITNKLPKIKFSDQATWNRIRVLPFEATFVKPGSDNPAPDTLEEQMKQKRFPAEANFDRKIPGLLQPLAWILIEHRRKLMESADAEKGIQIYEPKKVKIATERYKMANDMYTQFIKENIVKEARATVMIGDVYETFKAWFRSGFPNQQIPQRGDVQEMLSKAWKQDPLDGSKWRGYRLRTAKDDATITASSSMADIVGPEEDCDDELTSLF